MYPLEEILLLALLGVLAGAETFVDIARFGKKKLDFLQRFRPFAAGTPSHDHLGDIFATLDAEQFQQCFVKRSEEHTSELQSLMRISYAVFCLKKKNT